MKIDIKQASKEYEAIEEAFFEMDPERKTALISLAYESPADIFDESAATKTPLLSADFIETLIGAFDRVPDQYQLDLQITFGDLDGYTEEELAEIYKKNILQEIKTRARVTRRENGLALALCGVGVIFILLSILIGNVWESESIAKEIVVYVLDIVATVPFWGAMEICIIDNREKRRKITNITRRFHTIEFRQKADEA